MNIDKMLKQAMGGNINNAVSAYNVFNKNYDWRLSARPVKNKVQINVGMKPRQSTQPMQQHQLMITPKKSGIDIDMMTKNIFLKGQDIPDNKFDKRQLMLGMKVESEHSNNPKIQKAIAKAHLAESPVYYTYLAKMEMQMPKSDKQGKSITYPISSEGRHRVTAARDITTRNKNAWEKEWEKDFGTDFGLTAKEKAKRELGKSKAEFGGKVAQEKEMSDTTTPVFFGPRRKAKEGEYWAPFKIEDKQAFVLRKQSPSLKEAIDIMKTPFLTGEEKTNLIKEKGGSEELVKRAEQFSSGAHKTGFRKWRTGGDWKDNQSRDSWMPEMGRQPVTWYERGGQR